MLGWRAVLDLFPWSPKSTHGALRAVGAVWLGRSLERRELGHVVAAPNVRGWMFGMCQLSCRTSWWWAGYRCCDLAVGGGTDSLERWPSGRSQFNVKMLWCRNVLPSLVVWISQQWAPQAGLCQSRVPAGTPSPGCGEVSGFIIKCIPVWELYPSLKAWPNSDGFS